MTLKRKYFFKYFYYFTNNNIILKDKLQKFLLNIL